MERTLSQIGCLRAIFLKKMSRIMIFEERVGSLFDERLLSMSLGIERIVRSVYSWHGRYFILLGVSSLYILIYSFFIFL